MIFKSLAFANYKAYGGVAAFDLSGYSNKRPLYLVGGVNGAGKTSIIEAVKLCLYGERSFRPSKHYRSYNKFLFSIHNYNARGEDPQSSDFYIEVVFTIFEVGHSQELKIKRKWKMNKGEYSEQLELTLENEPFRLVHAHYWQEYIESLIPQGLANLVFFDSEQFRKVPSNLETGFVPALLNYFEVDQLKSLARDLDKYSIDMIKDVDSELYNTLQELSKLHRNKESELNELHQELNNILLNVQSKKENLSRVQVELSKLSGREASNLNMILRRRDEILASSHEQNRVFEEICSSTLPFALAQKLSNQLLIRLEQERDHKNICANKMFLDQALKAVKSKLDTSLNMSQFELIAKELKAEVGETSNDLLHDVTESRSHSIHTSLDIDLAYPISTIYNIQRKLKKFRSELSSLNLDLREINSKGPHAKLFEEMNQVKFDLLQMEDEAERLKSEIDFISKAISQVEIEYERKKKLSDELDVVDRKKESAQKASKIAIKYMNYVVQNRFTKLRNYFLDILDRLTTKTDLVNDIEFDPISGSLSFINSKQEKLNYNNFSAGESELIALALLWSVNRISSKNMPIIIDSPLNRLDNQHREKFVKHFIRDSGNQVIMLSTDEEFRTIQDYGVDELIAKAFTLVHTKKSKSTAIVPGYFNA